MSRAISVLFIGSAILLLLVGGLALGGWFLLNQSTEPNLARWTPLPDAVTIQTVHLTATLPLLAGENESTALDEALALGDWDSAFALLAYATDLTDAARVGNLMLIASRFEGAKKSVEAARLYQYAVVFTILSPELSDFTRVQNLLQAASRLRALNASEPARLALDQAYLITQYSSALANAARAQWLRQCAAFYQAWGVNNLADQAYKKANDFAAAKEENIAPVVTSTFTLASAPLSETVRLKEVKSARVRAARDLADALEFDPSQVPSDLVKTVGDKLYEEDTARLAFYQAELKKANDAAARVSVLREQAAWLALKWRVARKGFGVSLVGEWERDAASIGDALSDTLAELFQNANALATKSGVRAQEALIRTAFGWGYGGLYKNYDANDLRTRLNQVNEDLRDRAPDELRLDSFVRGETRIFLLVPIEVYGTGEKALPK